MCRTSVGIRGVLLFASSLLLDPRVVAQCDVVKMLPDDLLGGDRFSSVAIDGNVAACGSWNKHHPPEIGPGPEWAGMGGAYVFVYEDGVWNQVAILEPSDLAYDDEFALRLAIEGDVIVASAAQKGVGVVYVFERPTGGWSGIVRESARLTPALPTSASGFGLNLAIAGDVVAVSALNDSHAGASSGRVFVYQKPASGWADTPETAILDASDASAGDRFGVGLALTEDLLVAGADQGGNGGTGKAYVYPRPAGGWTSATESATLVAPGLSPGAMFGYSAAMEADTIAIGSIEFTSGGSGSVYVFSAPPAGIWSGAVPPTARLVSSDGSPGDQFGGSVAIHGESIFVGAVLVDNENGVDAGSAYLFRPSAAGWDDTVETERIIAFDGEAEDRFGMGLAVGSSHLLIGASDHDAVGANSGAIYAFRWIDALYRFEEAGRACVHLVVENDTPLRGGECAFSLDEAVASVVSVSRGPDFPPGDGLVTADLTPSGDACPPGTETGRALVGWVTTRTGTAVLPPGVHRIATIRLAVDPAASVGDVTPLRFSECVGDPPTRNAVTDEQGASRCTLVVDGSFSVLETRFVRGDANADGGIDISDAIRILTFLFAGGTAPECLDSADVNDADGVDITDPIYLLNWRFLGGAPPPAPYPGCGEDTTPDALTCGSYPRCDGC